MKRFYIQSGACDGIFEGDDCNEALQSAIRKTFDDGGKLGLLMSVVECVDSDISYVGTESVLKKMGLEKVS